MPSGTISGAGTGATAGAAIGTMIAPGVGTTIGAGVGAIAGGISGFVSDLSGWSAAGQEADYLGSELDTLNQSIADLTGLGTIRRGIELEKFEEQREQLASGSQMSLQDILESYNRATQQTGLQSGAVAEQRKRAITQVRAEQDFGMQNLITTLGGTLMAADEWQGGREASIKETIADVERRRKKAESESTPWPFD